MKSSHITFLLIGVFAIGLSIGELEANTINADRGNVEIKEFEDALATLFKEINSNNKHEMEELNKKFGPRILPILGPIFRAVISPWGRRIIAGLVTTGLTGKEIYDAIPPNNFEVEDEEYEFPPMRPNFPKAEFAVN